MKIKLEMTQDEFSNLLYMKNLAELYARIQDGDNDHLTDAILQAEDTLDRVEYEHDDDPVERVQPAGEQVSI